MGLWRSGFHVTGIDIRPQKNYPFRFIQADATKPPIDLDEFDLIWASPRCQEYVGKGLRQLADRSRKSAPRKPKLIEPVRDLLAASGALTVIENVPQAPLRRDIALDGDMFGLGTYRRRIFETNFFVLHPVRNRAFGPESRPGSVTLAGNGSGAKGRRYVSAKGEQRMNRAGTAAEWRIAIGVDWMTRDELKECVPPAYSEFIGRAALRELAHRRAAA
jgi:DNA (cytosine-5)-methyltransferase 1